MFEVLMFIFENYMDGSVALKADNETILIELEKVGFSRFEIDGALEWLEGLNRFQNDLTGTAPITKQAIRHYLPEEAEQLGVHGCGFLIYLEQLGILDTGTREVVIDRVMALQGRDVTMAHIKWVALMVLFSRPEQKSALTLLQDMILSDAVGVLH